MNGIAEKIISSYKELNPKETEGLIYAVLNNEGITNNELIRATGLPKETLKSFKQAISSYLQDPEEDKVLFKTEMAEELKKENLRPYSWSLCILFDEDLAQKIAKIRSDHQLEPKREFDQFFATPETTAAKVKVMREKGQVENKRIALLGDDDLVSIALGLSGEKYSEIVVFDIDDTILTIIEKISSELNLKNIRTKVYDARNELNKQDTGSFDVVVTDPPYTRNGIDLFLNTAVKLLKKEGYTFLYYGNSYKSPEKTIKIQDVILSYNLEIEDKINKFARYYGAESIGSASSLYILKKTPFTQPKEDSLINSNIYTFEDRKEEKFPYVEHYTFKVYGIPGFIISQKKAVTKLIDDFCAKHRLKIVDTKVTQFKGKGLTLTLILASSNLLVHTWPEHNALHIDLITCSPIYNRETMGETISELFQTKKVELRKIE